VRFEVLTAASLMFGIVFWDVLPYNIPEDNSEHHRKGCVWRIMDLIFLLLQGDKN
jgi:hypothetical protein